LDHLAYLQSIKGLAQYVLKMVDNAHERGLVVGYDHRHQSEHWAHLTAEVFISNGFKIHFLRGFNPTPL
jgi:phosphoglucomutase